MNSILLSFIFRFTDSIQSLAASIEDSIMLMVSFTSFPSLLGLNSFLTLWSSANPFSVRLVTIWSNVDYEMNRTAPCMEPCGTLKSICLIVDISLLTSTLNFLDFR